MELWVQGGHPVPETAEMLSLGRSRTYELISAGVIPSVRIEGSIRVPVEALLEWLATLNGK